MIKTLSYKELPKVPTLPSPGAGYLGVTVCLTSDNKPYYCNGTIWIDLSGGGGGGLTATSTKTSNYTAAANDLVRIDSSSTSFTITLPASPADGALVGISDISSSCATHPVLVERSGSNTLESDTGLSIDVNGAYIQLRYVSSTTNWKLEDTYEGAVTVSTNQQIIALHPFLLMGA